MPMDRVQPMPDPRSSPTVLSVECLKGGSKADEWTVDFLQTGDIVEELRIGGSGSRRIGGPGSVLLFVSPFKNGRSGVQKVLHDVFKKKETSILVRVRRGDDEFAELQACIVPNEAGGKKQYVLRSIADPNYVFGFVDRTEAECLELQASRSARMVSALSTSRLQDGFVAYPWERSLQECLSVPFSSCFLSILFLPKAADEVASRYNDLENTLARANAWLNASQTSGVSIVFMNIQTESLLTKISGETASSTVNAGSLSDLSNLTNASLYGFEDYHGVDIGVVKAVRLWYAPLGGEFSLEIKLRESDTKLGFAISRTEEGFIFISSVIEGDVNAPSTRSGLANLYREARNSTKLLVISRLDNQKVLPWVVSSTGAIRCFDTVSLSQKLSLHRHAKVPISLHMFLWDQSLAVPGGANRFRAAATQHVRPIQPEVRLAPPPNENQTQPSPVEVPSESREVGDGPQVRLERDTAGEVSFRFHDFALSSNWV